MHDRKDISIDIISDSPINIVGMPYVFVDPLVSDRC